MNRLNFISWLEPGVPNLVRWMGFEPTFATPVTANGLEVRPGYQRISRFITIYRELSIFVNGKSVLWIGYQGFSPNQFCFLRFYKTMNHSGFGGARTRDSHITCYYNFRYHSKMNVCSLDCVITITISFRFYLYSLYTFTYKCMIQHGVGSIYSMLSVHRFRVVFILSFPIRASICESVVLYQLSYKSIWF